MLWSRLARHDPVPPARARTEDPGVADEVEAGRGHQSGQLLHQLLRLEDDVGSAVAPAVLQAMVSATVFLLPAPGG